MTDSQPNYSPIRRVVTGHDESDVAEVLIDGPATNAKHPSPGTVSTLIWSTDRSPASIVTGRGSRIWARGYLALRRPSTERVSL